MKPWDYYNLKGNYAFHIEIGQYYQIRNRLVEKIKNKQLTESQRDKLISQTTERAQKITHRVNRAYYAERAKRLDEFKIDLREAIGYNDLPAATIATIESKAWEEGHVHSLPGIYSYTRELVTFTREVISQQETNGNRTTGSNESC